MRALMAMAAGVCLSLAACCTPAAAEEPMFKHGGMYVGLAGGYSTTALTAEGVDLAGQGAFGGAFLGFGTVADGLYFGIEFDAMLRDIKPSLSEGGTTVQFSNQWMGSARGRVGVPIGPALLYATGGVAVTPAKLSVTSFGSDEQYSIGGVGGLGIELITFKNLAVRVEALHYAFPTEKFNIEGVEASIKQGETVARVGVSFKLN